MKLKDFYKFVINEGVAVDPRGKKGVADELKRVKDGYDDLPSWKKDIFDKILLTNPYADTRILHGNPEMDVKTILVGIDIEMGELLLADRLNQKGTKIDLIMAHHPEGKALAGLYQVMYLQADVLNKYGVPINVAEGLMAERIKEVRRRLLPVNHTRAVDGARLLDLPFMCAHTPCDNHVVDYLQKLLNKKKPRVLKDIVEMLEEIPEYRNSIKNDVPPTIVSGTAQRRCGNVFVDMTGGTEGSRKIFEKLSKTDIGTVVGMHFTDEHVKEAEKNNINLIIAGHMASDNLGINLFLDKASKKDKKLNIISCSGFYRFSRN
ncbi:MAG: hypothetical protein P9M13_04440 [Candidatus Ancaeobacter aquaticus]|nr:hypothetical protein [Candidatus Ancaeobacter aquaticus]